MTDQVRLSIGSSTVFVSRALGLGVTAVTSVLLARMLGPAAMGGYYLLVLLPTTTLAVMSFGLPSALTYHAGRGEDLNQLRTLALGSALVVSTVVVAILVLGRPFFTSTILAAAPAELVPIAIAAVPAVFVQSCATAVILGRQRLDLYSAMLAAQPIALLLGQLIVVGVLHAGLAGAVATYLVVVAMMAVASTTVMLRLEPFAVAYRRDMARRLTRFGLAAQPASLAGFLNYRADVYLMSALLHDAAALGIYGLAVNVAELCFFVPDAVATVFFPRVSASSREQGAAMVPVVTRVVLLLASGVAVMLGVIAAVGIPFVLPAYTGSIGPALVLLPGVVGLSASKVLSAFLTGSGLPGVVSAVSTGAVALNVAANLVLIPAFGPVGAAAASLISYSFHGITMLIVSSRRAATSIARLAVARKADIALLKATLRGLAALGVRR